MDLLPSALLAARLVEAASAEKRAEEPQKHQVFPNSKKIKKSFLKTTFVNFRCRYEGTTSQHGPLLLVMEYYSAHVNPQCPSQSGCQCVLTKVQVNKLFK